MEHWEQKKRNLARGTEGFKRNSVSSILEKNKRGGGGDLETVGFLKTVGKERGEGGSRGWGGDRESAACGEALKEGKDTTRGFSRWGDDPVN